MVPPTPPPQDPGARTPPIWVLTGPTAVGKTALALGLAAKHDLEILSMDSMAVYQRMDIGTAKPTEEERGQIPHHLLDLVPPSASFDTSMWCRAAEDAVEGVRARGKQPLLVGGTPLYLMAFGKGMVEGPGRDDALRAALEDLEDREPGALHGRLTEVDPEAAARIHRNDRKRLIRALEVFQTTGKPISAQQDHFAQDTWRRPCRIVAVGREREDLHQRVNQRTRAMLAAGLVEEVRGIRESCGFSATAAGGIGYRECLDWLNGRYKDEEELRNRIRRATHGLIRRQLTWLRKMPEVHWVPPDASVDDVGRWLAAGSAT